MLGQCNLSIKLVNKYLFISNYNILSPIVDNIENINEVKYDFGLSRIYNLLQKLLIINKIPNFVVLIMSYYGMSSEKGENSVD